MSKFCIIIFIFFTFSCSQYKYVRKPIFFDAKAFNANTISYNKKDIPQKIIKKLHTDRNRKFLIVNPNELYVPSDLFIKGHPNSQLIFLASDECFGILAFKYQLQYKAVLYDKCTKELSIIGFGKRIKNVEDVKNAIIEGSYSMQ